MMMMMKMSFMMGCAFGLTPDSFNSMVRPELRSLGVTPPFTKEFDPLQLAKKVDDQEYARLRESELKHGRWAMLASVIIPSVESQLHEPAIHYSNKLPIPVQLGILSLIGLGEFSTMKRGYENPFEDGWTRAFKLKKEYQPGDLGLGSSWMPKDKFIKMSNMELNNGRLAMFGALGMIAQELVTDKTLF